MKKLTSLFLAAMLLFLVSCSAEKTDKQPKETEKTKSEAVNVDKGLLSVTITLPATMFEDQNVDEVVANAQKEGITATKNADGSVTYKMSKSKHKEMMQEMKTTVIQTINDAKTGKDFQSIKDITYKDDFSEFTLVVDKAAYENSFDGFAALGLGMSGMMYELFNGVKPEEYKVTINIKDQATQNVFDQIVYPDALDKK
ncbi:hypothetical protein [Neobacillus sp. SAB-20_R2A]|uniref:hypothetical protein n=1 Tax=Neobacillus sp. SAB-20_R2A TaxID=3120519 RepID=UPI003C6E3512